MNDMNNDVGEAYALFYCGASKEIIEGELSTICELVDTPYQLELSLTEGTYNIKGDKELSDYYQEAGQDDRNYMLKATCPDETNKDTADELLSILNQAYQSPLYKPKDQFNGVILYEENGQLFRKYSG